MPDFGEHRLYVYWFFCILAMSFATLLALILSRYRSLQAPKAAVLAITANISALLFIHLFAVYFSGTFKDIFVFQKGGYLSFAAIVGVFFNVTIMAKFLKVSLGDVFDITACVVPMTQAIQRIGCFFNGCCYGAVSDSILAVRYPGSIGPDGIAAGSPCFLRHFRTNLIDSSDLYSLPVFPIQLAATAACLLIASVCIWMLIKNRFNNRVIYIYLILYGVARFVIQSFRPDYDATDFVSAFNSGHYVSAAMLITAVVMLILAGGQKKYLSLCSSKKMENRKCEKKTA